MISNNNSSNDFVNCLRATVGASGSTKTHQTHTHAKFSTQALQTAQVRGMVTRDWRCVCPSSWDAAIAIGVHDSAKPPWVLQEGHKTHEPLWSKNPSHWSGMLFFSSHTFYSYSDTTKCSTLMSMLRASFRQILDKIPEKTCHFVGFCGHITSIKSVMQDSSMNFFEKGCIAPLLEKIHTPKQQRPSIKSTNLLKIFQVVPQSGSDTWEGTIL